MYTKEFKRMAKNQLKGHFHTLSGGWFVYFIIYIVMSGFVNELVMAWDFIPEENVFDQTSWEQALFVASFIPAGVLMGFLYMGLINFQLDLANNEEVDERDIFAFLPLILGSSTLAFLLHFIFALIYYPIVVTSAVFFYFSSMAKFIYAEDPSTSPIRAIIESCGMMRGNNFALFMLHLSFIPLHLFSVLTCGLGYLYVFPYIIQSEANFYNHIK